MTALRTTICPVTRLPSKVTDELYDASRIYNENARDYGKHYSPQLADLDDVKLGEIGRKLHELAKAIAHHDCYFVEANPKTADVLELLAETVMDVVGGPAGSLIRAHARVFSQG